MCLSLSKRVCMNTGQAILITSSQQFTPMANFLVVQGLQLLLTVMIYISTLEQEKLLYTKTWQET